ncbi:hypothetical protein [Nitrospira japonica]|uniref:hypothetical protein n=1 Tax=Nitrospira japonica TaxID=1325564 RepID=UPI0012DDB810|nr:hypothetical protein [Nitrospira japonica]
MKPVIETLFRAKQQRRKKLVALPFPEKVRAVIRMQQMAAPILLARGKSVRVWELGLVQDGRLSSGARQDN